jgi:hypothetical protein
MSEDTPVVDEVVEDTCGCEGGCGCDDLIELNDLDELDFEEEGAE